MDAFAQKIDTLKTMLVTEDKFDRTLGYFFDNLGYDRAFLDAGKPTTNQTLQDILKSLVTQACGEGSAITQLKIFKAGKSKFIHGMCFINGGIGTVLFFEDLNVGLLAVSSPVSMSDISYIRFSGTIIDPDQAAFFTGAKSKAMH